MKPHYPFALLVLALAIDPSPAAASGVEMGNGGDVVVCSKDLGTIRSIELLDYYEAYAMRDILIDLGPPSLSVEDKVEIALSRLERHWPKETAALREFARRFMDDALFLKDVILRDIPDSGHVAVPKNCSIEQIAIQQEPRFPEDKRYIIDDDLWTQMDSTAKAGLILHEILYREAMSRGHQNSIATRYFNSYIASSRLEAMTREDFSALLGRTGFNWPKKRPQWKHPPGPVILAD